MEIYLIIILNNRLYIYTYSIKFKIYLYLLNQNEYPYIWESLFDRIFIFIFLSSRQYNISNINHKMHYLHSSTHFVFFTKSKLLISIFIFLFLNILININIYIFKRNCIIKLSLI